MSLVVWLFGLGCLIKRRVAPPKKARGGELRVGDPLGNACRIRLSGKLCPKL